MQVLLKEWRQRRLLTQEALAALAGVGVATIARIEEGKTVARLSTLRKLADALRVTPEQLVIYEPGEATEEGKRAA